MFLAVASNRLAGNLPGRVLAKNNILRRDRRNGKEYFLFFVLDRNGIEGYRHFHRNDRHKLGQMVLNHIAESPGLLVVGPAMLDAEIFGNGNLNVLDGVAFPERYKNRVREAERQELLHRLFAEVMIDAVDLGFLDIAMQGRVEVSG